MISIYRNNEHGFTLIEVLISLAILAFISLGIYNATTGAFKLRESLSVESDFYNNIRLAMGIVQRDISLIYTPVIMLPGPPKNAPSAPGVAPPPLSPTDTIAMKNLLVTDLGQTTKYWEPVIDPSGIRPSRFTGTDSKLSFISLSHIRIYKNSAESEFAKINYELERDEDKSAINGTSVLVKSESPDAFEDDEHKDKFGRKFPLLRGIKKMTMRYYRKDKDTWERSWDSDKEDQKNLYPDIVEITITAQAADKLSFDGIYKFRPEIPLRGLDPKY